MEWLTKSLDLLKASGWQLAMIAAAAGAFLLLPRLGVVSELPDLWKLGAWAILLASALLAVAPVLAAIQGAVAAAIERARAKRNAGKAVEDAKARFRAYLPHMTEHDKAILGYLLKRNEKFFTADIDAGYGAGLMALGFIRRVGAPGQAFDYDKMPMAVPDYVWDVMKENPGLFEYQPRFTDRDKTREVQPWRIPYQAR